MRRAIDPGSLKGFTLSFFQLKTLDGDRLVELARRSVPFQRRLIERLSHAAGPLVGNPFPRTWEAMRAPKLPNVLDAPDLAIPWSVAKVTALRQRLNPALRARRRLEGSLIAGRPAECETLLDEFERSWGCSLWTMAVRFVAAQFARGFHGNRTALRQFADSCSNDWIHLLAQNSSFRALLNISTREYTETVGVMVPRSEGDDVSAYVDDYLNYRLFDEVPATDSAVCNVLHFESRHSILDLYDTTVRILSRTVRGSAPERVARAAVHLCRDIPDGELSGLAAAAADGDFDGPIAAGLDECLHLFSLGQYARCLQRSREELLRDPTTLVLFDLVAAAAVWSRSTTSCPEVFPAEAPGQLLLSALYDWYSARTFRRQSIEDLRRLARALSPTRVGAALSEFIALFDRQQCTLGRDCLGLLATVAPVPQFAYGYADPARARSFLSRLRSRIGCTGGVGPVENYLQLLDDPSAPLGTPVPEHEELRFRAAAFHAMRRWPDVARALERLREIAPEEARARPELLVCEAESLLEMGELERAAGVLGRLFCEDRRLLPPMLLRRVAAILKDEAFRPDPTNLGWPILAAAAHGDDRSQIGLDRIHDFVGDYIESQKATRPTELIAGKDALPVELIVFLTECCTPEILESSIWFHSREELYKERLQLCEALIDRFQYRDGALQKEIAALTRQLAILDLTSEIQRSRIFIDTAAILKNLDEATWSQTNSMLTVRALRSNELQRGLKLLRMPNPEGNRVTVVLVDEEKTFFEKVFERIRQQFLYSPELGLDANLSQRIRHGTLAGELRAIFDRLRLSTKIQGDGSYEPNHHWCDVLVAGWNPALAGRVNEAFRTFSRGLDDRIRVVREDWVQIHSEAIGAGLFDYQFSEGEIDGLLKTISPLAEHEDVHELVAGALLERTERCLALVRRAFSEQLTPAIDLLLDDLVASVEALLGSGSQSVVSLRNVVTQCKTEFARQVEQIQGWFHVENRHEQKPFRFPDLVGGVEQVLSRIGSPCTVAPLRAKGREVRIRGTHFRALWDLLVILFDNASRHSGVESVDIELAAEFARGATRLRCVNDMAPDCDVALLREKAAQLNQLSLAKQSDLNKLRQEGGSGTAKLHKIVRHEIGQDRSAYGIIFGVTQDRRFEVTISLEMGLTDEDPAD